MLSCFWFVFGSLAALESGSPKSAKEIRASVARLRAAEREGYKALEEGRVAQALQVCFTFHI